VTQINGQINDIWTTATPYVGGVGTYSWYPNGGNNGYSSR
jgi:hypothetical protein